jgi:dsRNA-specific ribonuclease
MKSKIVNRKNLNKLGEELQLTQFIQNGQSNTLGENIAGNLLEAFIGAIYLDVNYKTCETVVINWLLKPQEIVKLEKESQYPVRNYRRSFAQQKDSFQKPYLAEQRKPCTRFGIFQEKGRRKSSTKSILYLK